MNEINMIKHKWFLSLIALWLKLQWLNVGIVQTYLSNKPFVLYRQDKGKENKWLK